MNNSAHIQDIAHGARTSLATIKTGISGTKDYLEKLIATYEIASQHQLTIPEISPQEFALLKEVLDLCETEVKNINDYVDLLKDTV